MKRRQKITEHYFIPFALACLTVGILNLLWLLRLPAAAETNTTNLFLTGLALVLLLLSLKYRNFYLVMLADAFFLLVFIWQLW
jgi:hypothetical protein